MAKICDSDGNLLGGLGSSRTATIELSSEQSVPQTKMNPRYGQEETVPGLGCSYGSFGYISRLEHSDKAHGPSRLTACHNPVEEPDERHHCSFCGGDYCSVHAEQAEHECDCVILPY